MKLKDVSVGTKVRWKGELFTVMGEDVPNRNGLVGHKWGKGERDWISPCAEVELVNEGPIRTVTRREIVPGVYGRVEVIEHDMVYGVHIGLVHKNCYMTAEELREAAHLFNQIAEVLEDASN